jgi:hypothetical protein
MKDYMRISKHESGRISRRRLLGGAVGDMAPARVENPPAAASTTQGSLPRWSCREISRFVTSEGATEMLRI